MARDEAAFGERAKAEVFRAQPGGYYAAPEEVPVTLVAEDVYGRARRLLNEAIRRARDVKHA